MRRKFAIILAFCAGLIASPAHASTSPTVTWGESSPVYTWADGFPVIWSGGDSFNSGEGTDYDPTKVYNPPQGSYIPGTFTTCKRTTRAAGYELAAELGAELRFPACAGSTTQDILNGKFNEPSQLDSLDSNVDIGLVSGGGINIGFGGIVSKVLLGTLSTSSSEYTNAINVIANSLPGDLDTLYSEIAARIGSNTKVLVTTYPFLPNKTGGVGLVCALYVTATERNLVINLEEQLNAAIRSAVARQNDPRFIVVDTTAAGSEFSVRDVFVPGLPGVGRDACSGSSKTAFNTIRFGIGDHNNIITTGAFHPNALGHDYYRSDFKKALGL